MSDTSIERLETEAPVFADVSAGPCCGGSAR